MQQVGNGIGPATATTITIPQGTFTQDETHALLWNGSASNYVDLNPSGFVVGSAATAISGNQEVGYGAPPGTNQGFDLNGSNYHALVWNGTAASYSDLNPTGFLISEALGTNGSQQIGIGYVTDTNVYDTEQALLWSGSAASVVNLQSVLPTSDTWAWSYPLSIDSSGNVFGYAVDSSENYFAMEWSPPTTLTWNNAGGTGDGRTWDTYVNQNWDNNATAAFFHVGDNITFNDANNATSDGGSNPNAYNVILNSTVAPASILVNNSLGNYTISGTGSIGGTGSLTKSGTGTLTLSTANTYSGGTNVNAGVLLIEPTSPTTSALPTGALSISGSGLVQLAANVTAGSQSANPPNTAPTSNVNLTSLSITGNGTLDIGNNHIIIDYGSGPDPIASIATWIADGAYGSGTTVTWTGTGITSSAAAANAGRYGIGYADSADVGDPAGLASGTIEIMYTLLGDANLDGKVNGIDFNLLATNFNQAVTNGWDEGDFNYDGKVNGIDFNLLADNFNQFASQSAVSAADWAALESFAAANGISLGLTSVPEPASIGLVAIACLGGLSRRRFESGDGVQSRRF